MSTSSIHLLKTGQSTKDMLTEKYSPSSSVIMRNILLIIDPQIDFHPEGGSGALFHPNGSLAIPGANEDTSRIATMIKEHLQNIDEIFVTLDTHHVINIIYLIVVAKKRHILSNSRQFFALFIPLFLLPENTYCTCNVLGECKRTIPSTVHSNYSCRCSKWTVEPQIAWVPQGPLSLVH